MKLPGGILPRRPNAGSDAEVGRQIVVVLKSQAIFPPFESLHPKSAFRHNKSPQRGDFWWRLVDREGFEPSTLALRGPCSNQLSYQSKRAREYIGKAKEIKFFIKADFLIAPFFAFKKNIVYKWKCALRKFFLF